MSADWYTKLVLTVIAVCLAALVVQSFGGGAGAGASGPEEGRYRLTPLPMARMLFRMDSNTGRTWRAMFPDLTVWTVIPESPDELLDAASAEESAGTREPAEPSAPETAAPEAPATP